MGMRENARKVGECTCGIFDSFLFILKERCG